jgi:Homeodomain-like domain
MKLLEAHTDNALAARSVKGDGAAFAELARRYARLIDHATRRPALGLEREDQRQIALLALFEACRAADRERWDFGAIATVCIRRRVWNAVVSAHTGKHRVLSTAVPLHFKAGEGEEGMSLAERIPARDGHDPALIVELREELRCVARRHGGNPRRSRRRRFTDADRAQALALIADGKTQRQAAAAVGASHSTVGRWLESAA